MSLPTETEEPLPRPKGEEPPPSLYSLCHALIANESNEPRNRTTHCCCVLENRVIPGYKKRIAKEKEKGKINPTGN